MYLHLLFQYTEYRLAGGRVYSSFKEGRLEVRLAGSNEWGVVCGDNWDFRAAIVTCKHLGVGYARTAQTVCFTSFNIWYGKYLTIA